MSWALLFCGHHDTKQVKTIVIAKEGAVTSDIH